MSPDVLSLIAFEPGLPRGYSTTSLRSWWGIADGAGELRPLVALGREAIKSNRRTTIRHCWLC